MIDNKFKRGTKHQKMFFPLFLFFDILKDFYFTKEEISLKQGFLESTVNSNKIDSYVVGIAPACTNLLIAIL